MPSPEVMRRAIELARHSRTHPNPRVGAVVVNSSGLPVGEGAHSGPARPHAERIALEDAGAAARGGVLYVTLEPCNHHGLTPPCTDAILASGVDRVVVAVVDPDPRVSGAGIERLRNAGVEVEVGLLSQEAAAMDPAYFHHRRTGRPLVTLKAALTLDGQTAAADGRSRWITGEEARADAHRLRANADAVMVGAGTLLADDPQLTARLPGYTGPQPRPVVILGVREVAGKRVLERPDAVVVAPTPVSTAGELILAPGPEGVDLAAALAALADRGLIDVLVEGGARLAGSLWRAGLVDRGVFYVGGLVAGGRGRGVMDGDFPTLSSSRRIRILQVARLGADLRIDWEV